MDQGSCHYHQPHSQHKQSHIWINEAFMLKALINTVILDDLNFSKVKISG